MHWPVGHDHVDAGIRQPAADCLIVGGAGRGGAESFICLALPTALAGLMRIMATQGRR